MIRVARIVLVLFIVLLVAENADARWRLFRRRRSSRSTTYSKNLGVSWTGAVAIRVDDQAACQKEANYMARNGIRGHVWGKIGVFEGCGWGAYGGNACRTCRPTWGATLTGDATAVSSWGEKFRVRSWR
jgi:hypothetical protein